MKFLVLLVLVAAASAARLPLKKANLAELEEIMAAIHSPSTDPATAAALQQMLLDIFGIGGIDIGPAIIDPEDISVGPAVIDEIEDISVGPAIIDEIEDISVGPAIIDDFEEISVGPAIIDDFEEISVGPAIIDPSQPAFNPFAFNGPLVQVIVNVDSASSDVTVEQPAVIPSPGSDYDEIKPDQVIVVDEAEQAVIEPEVINVDTPIFPDNAANLPEQLN